MKILIISATFFCIFNFIFTSSQASPISDACDDLYSFACLDSSGKPKKSTSGAQIRSTMYEVINQGRNKVAKAMGYKDLDEALIAQLKADGIEIKTDTPSEIFDLFKNKPDVVLARKLRGRKFSPEVEKCYQQAQKTKLADFDKFMAEWEEKSIPLRAKHLAGFITGYIASQCKVLRDEEDEINLKANVKVVETCQKFPELKKQAELLNRFIESPDYQKKAEQFVRENLLPEIVYKDAKKNRQIRNDLETVCHEYGSVFFGRAQHSADLLMLRMSQNKVMVDHLIQNHYSQDRKDQFEKLLEENKKALINVLDPIIKDPAKKQKILDQFRSISFTWMEPLGPEKYIKSKKDGQMYLDWQNLSVKESEDFGVFDSEDLSHFYEVNASYSRKSKTGEYEEAERITFMPSFLSQLSSNPDLVSEVLGHELAHKVDPNQSQINGHSMLKELEPLMSCLAQEDSIKMRVNQRGEATSDSLAAEVIGVKMKALKNEQEKLQLLTNSMAGYCSFESDQIVGFVSDNRAVHPAPRLRVGGLFGANSSVRKALGCEKPSKDFKTCGLDSPPMPIVKKDWDGQSADVNSIGNKGSAEPAVPAGR